MPQKSLAGSINSISTYPLTLGMLRPLTTRQTTSRRAELDRIRVSPAGKLFALRRAAPLSNTMTVFNSSRIGCAGLPASVGRLRSVTSTSRHTGFERVERAELLLEVMGKITQHTKNTGT